MKSFLVVTQKDKAFVLLKLFYYNTISVTSHNMTALKCVKCILIKFNFVPSKLRLIFCNDSQQYLWLI